MKKYLEIGKITGVKGLRGEVTIEPWCDTPDFLKKFKILYFNEGKNKLSVVSSRVHKSSVIILFDEIQSQQQALECKGKTIYINREDVKLEKGRYFIQDLIGISVLDADSGYNYGEITEVFKTGANDVYQVTDNNGKNYLVPVISDVVIKTDIENNKIIIRPLEGIFDDEN